MLVGGINTQYDITTGGGNTRVTGADTDCHIAGDTSILEDEPALAMVEGYAQYRTTDVGSSDANHLIRIGRRAIRQGDLFEGKVTVQSEVSESLAGQVYLQINTDGTEAYIWAFRQDQRFRSGRQLECFIHGQASRIDGKLQFVSVEGEDVSVRVTVIHIVDDDLAGHALVVDNEITADVVQGNDCRVANTQRIDVYSQLDELGVIGTNQGFEKDIAVKFEFGCAVIIEVELEIDIA